MFVRVCNWINESSTGSVYLLKLWINRYQTAQMDIQNSFFFNFMHINIIKIQDYWIKIHLISDKISNYRWKLVYVAKYIYKMNYKI